MRKRASMLRELRGSLVEEALRAGMSTEKAEAYATKEIASHSVELDKNATLRRAVRGCRVLAQANR